LRRVASIAAAAFLSLIAALPANAQSSIPRFSVIRDAEIENIIRAYAAPVFAAAGLPPGSVRVHLINDASVNAFVANGLNLFIFTGLLLRTDDAGQVIGVIAHESGHIAGGHLVRARDAMRNATIQMILAMVLGAAAGVASGNPGAAGGGMMLGQQVAERSFLAYSREMEAQADQAGLGFLERARISARGMERFMSGLADQELLAVGRQDPYLRTHPITRERVEHIRNFLLTTSRYADAPLPPQFVEMHARMRAKLLGYLEPDRALAQYREGDTSIPARYARAIAYSRKSEIDRAIALIDSLLRERPSDPYFLDTKAQILLEAQRPQDAIPLYQRAVQALPEDPLIRTALGNAQVQSGQPDQIRAAIATLERSRQLDATYGETWRLLSLAYARNNQPGQADLAQAELTSLNQEWREARMFADRALRTLPAGTPAALRASDIKATAERESRDPRYRREQRERDRERDRR
jgi:predicted Zn-dependent protease